MFAKCEYIECEKSNDCKRFLQKDSAVVEYKYICPSFDHRWFVQKDVEIIIKSEGEANAQDSDNI